MSFIVFEASLGNVVLLDREGRRRGWPEDLLGQESGNLSAGFANSD